MYFSLSAEVHRGLIDIPRFCCASLMPCCSMGMVLSFCCRTPSAGRGIWFPPCCPPCHSEAGGRRISLYKEILRFAQDDNDTAAYVTRAARAGAGAAPRFGTNTVCLCSP